jgi:peptide chain release factor 3
MDPAHRDRIAFVRVASGHFERGMRLKVTRSGKELKPNTVVSFLSQRRELLDEAFAGDIIGIPNHGVLQLADTLTEGEALQFTGLPFFAPEMFRSVEVADPLRTKQLRAGLTQLGEEGAIQVFRPVAGSVLLLGAVGQLQFEVVAHRLEHEYGVKARIAPARYNVARWVTAETGEGAAADERELERFIDANAHRVALDAVDAPCVLLEYAGELRAMQENWPKIRFHALREHAGLVFQKQLDG